MRKNRILLSLLCAGSLITQSGISVMASESQPVEISDTSDILPSEIFDVYHKEDQIDFDQILKSYQAYLEGDDEFKKQTDDLFRERDPESGIFKMTCAYIELLQKIQLSAEDAQYFHNLIEKVREVIPELPSLDLPAVPPVEEEQKPEDEAPEENPEQEPDENQPAEVTKPEETTPEENQPADDSQDVPAPDETDPAKPSAPENNETNSSGEASDPLKPEASAPQDNTEEKPVAVIPGQVSEPVSVPEVSAPAIPANQAGVSTEIVQPEASVSAPVIEQLVNAELKTPAGASFVNVASFQAIAFGTDRKISIDGLGSFQLLPDFTNDAAWRKSSSGYNTPRLWGQCTWFAWGRFYELYGFNPGFTGNGYQCVDQLIAAHGDQFVKSDMPASGAVFSGDADHNHVGIVLEYDPETNLMTVQEGNLDGISNEDWNVAIQDYRTIRVTPEDLRVMYGDVTYAVPKNGAVTVVKSASLKKKPLRTIVLNKLRKSFSNQ